MNIAITGHASGIGHGLYNFYKNENCVGFDLTNGYNINTDIDDILIKSRHCNVFINNAYSKNKQAELATAWHKMHADDDYLLVNISSTFVNLTKDDQIKIKSPCLMEYIKYKAKLNQASEFINSSNDTCRSVTVLVGLTDTQFINNWATQFSPYESEYFTKLIAECSLLDIADVVDTVDFVIRNNNNRKFISSISLSNKIG